MDRRIDHHTVRPRTSNLIRGRNATNIRHGSRQGQATRKGAIEDPEKLDPFDPNKYAMILIRVGLVCVTSSGESGLKLVGSKADKSCQW